MLEAARTQTGTRAPGAVYAERRIVTRVRDEVEARLARAVARLREPLGEAPVGG